MIQHIWDIIKADVETNFHKYWTKAVASRAYIKIFHKFDLWPTLWPNMTQFQKRLR